MKVDFIQKLGRGLNQVSERKREKARMRGVLHACSSTRITRRLGNNKIRKMMFSVSQKMLSGHNLLKMAVLTMGSLGKGV